jgi:hypothetical protein
MVTRRKDSVETQDFASPVGAIHVEDPACGNSPNSSSPYEGEDRGGV